MSTTNSKDITITPGVIPKCPVCGQVEWMIMEKIEREADLERVDKLGDLVIKKPDEGFYDQSIMMECRHCYFRGLPQANIKSYQDNQPADKVEAWYQDTGLYSWPQTVENEISYE